MRNAAPWVAGPVTVGARVTNDGHAYEVTNAGTGASTIAPTGASGSIDGGNGVVFALSSAVDFTDLNAFGAANATLSNPTELRFWNDIPGTMWSGATNVTIVNSPTTGLTLTRHTQRR